MKADSRRSKRRAPRTEIDNLPTEETSWRSSTHPSLESPGLLLTGILLLVFACWLYAPALALPVSLFDEAVYLGNLDRVWSRWTEEGLIWALRNDVFTVNRALKPGAPIAYALAYSLTGENRVWMHALLLGCLIITVAGAVLLPWMETRRLGGLLPKPVPAVSAVVAALLILGGEVPDWSGVQALRVNWYRLHTSEALIAPLLALHTVLIVAALRTGRRRRSWVALVLAMGCVLAAGTTKLTAFAHFGPPVALAMLLALARHPFWKPLALGALGSIVLAAGYTLFLKSLTPASGKTYFTDYALNPSQMLHSARFFAASFHRMLGPILLILVPAMGFRIWSEWLRLHNWRGVLERNAVVLYCLLGCAASVVAALPWPHLLPRYLLPPYLLLCLAISIELLLQAEWFSREGDRRLWWGLLVGAVAVLALRLSLLLLAILFLAFLLRRRHHQSIAQGFVLGVFAVGMAYFLLIAPLSRRAILEDYVSREKADARLLAWLTEEFAQKRSLGFLGDTGDERIGAISFFAQRKLGFEPMIRSVGSLEEAKQFDLLLVEEPTGGRNLQPLPMRKEFFGSFEVPRPISFWDWRRQLWQGTIAFPQKWAAVPPGWTVYSARETAQGNSPLQ